VTLAVDEKTDNGTDGQTDGQTDRQSATQYAAPPREEGRIIIVRVIAFER